MNRVPLPRTFMLISILGFLIVSVFTFNPFFHPSEGVEKPKFTIPLPWGIAFDIVFVIMLISSILSITPPELEKRRNEDEKVREDVMLDVKRLLKSSKKPKRKKKKYRELR